jgi:hypothetical protein
MKQRHAEFALQRLYLMADRAVGDMQFGAGTRKIPVARGDLKGTQRGERRQARGPRGERPDVPAPARLPTEMYCRLPL